MTKRTAHTLNRPKRVTRPEHVIFVDTETIPTPRDDGTIEQVFKLGVAIYVRFRRDNEAETKKVYRFTDTSTFWDIVLACRHSRSILYLMSHNSVFDFTVLQHITNLTRIGYDCQFVFDNNMTFIAKWRDENHTIMILNTANWFAGTVAKWGDALDLPKLKMPKGLKDNEKLFTYCQRDADILYHLFCWYCRFLDVHNLGSWKFTIASSAFYAFRYRFMRHPIYVPDDPVEEQLARESYHGGRTEVFRVGDYEDGPYHKLDVNSMYPFVMKHHTYPTKFEGSSQECTIPQMTYLLRNHCVIADVSINCTEPFYPFLNGIRYVYPVGDFRCTLTTGELVLAIKNDWLTQVHSLVWYRSRNLFSEYVDFFYGLKQQYGREGNKLLRNFTKLYLNSLYGKFGQRGYEDKVIQTVDEVKMWVQHGINAQTGERFMLRQIGKNIMYTFKKGEAYNAFTAIASHVTAYARLYLYSLIIKIGRPFVYYCDTDSIIVDDMGYSKALLFLNSNVLGALKSEGSSKDVRIKAPKHYYFDGHWTRKGVRKSAQQLGPNTFRQETWPGLNSILNAGRETYYNYFTTKRLSPEIISGYVDVYGYVKPFIIHDGSIQCSS